MGEDFQEPYLAGRVEDVMTTDPIAVLQDESISALVDLFLEHHYHGVPVTDSEGRLVGVARDAEVLALFATREPFVGQYRTVGDIMHTPPFVIGPKETIQRAAMKMFIDGTRFLVVVGKNNKIAGVVTRIDLIKGIRWKDTG